MSELLFISHPKGLEERHTDELDMVPNPSEDAALAMCKEPRRLSRNYRDEIAGTSFYTFWFRYIPELIGYILMEKKGIQSIHNRL